MQRSLRTAGALLLTVLAVPAGLRAQRVGDYNDARLISAVSAASLGQLSGLSLGLSTPSLSYGGPLAFGELPLGPGAFRFVAGHPSDWEGYGLGYGALLGQRTLAPFARMTIGAELSLNYLGYRLRPPTTYVGNGTFTNAHLTVPLGLQLGNVNRLSITPYVAPYAEVGSAPSGYFYDPQSVAPGQPCQDLFSCKYLYSGHHQTEALGAAVGFRLTVWHFAIDAATADLPSKEQFTKYRTSLGVSLRF